MISSSQLCKNISIIRFLQSRGIYSSIKSNSENNKTPITLYEEKVTGSFGNLPIKEWQRKQLFQVGIESSMIAIISKQFRGQLDILAENKIATKFDDHEKYEDPNRRSTIVSSPHPVSNLRLTLYPVKKNPTATEKMFYQVHRETQEWNQSYWEKHNTEFQQSKNLYIEEYKRTHRTSNGSEPVLTAEEMSRFYKMFLDRNHAKHVRYNWEWYQKNFYLLWLSLKASTSRILVHVKMKTHHG